MTTVDSRTVLEISDSGIGIPEELLPRIFDRFVRVDPSRGEVNGSGLGLAIARTIVEAHDGTLTAGDREDGRSGARIVLDLPAWSDD